MYLSSDGVELSPRDDSSSIVAMLDSVCLKCSPHSYRELVSPPGVLPVFECGD